MENTTQNQMENNIPKLNFRPGSRPETIYKLHYVEQKTLSEIVEITNYPQKDVDYYIKQFQKKIAMTTGTVTTQTNFSTAIQIKVYEQNGNIVLFVKTCKQFEDYLKAHNEIRDSEQLWGQRKSGKFYQNRIVNDYSDDINRPIISNGTLNFGVLRIPGISDGVEFKLDGLLTQKQLEQSIKKLITTFNTFYKTKIITQTINIEAEVLVENEN